jgi:hypothetical protein
MLTQALELVNRREHIHQLHNTPAEQVETTEDQRLGEVELLALGEFGKQICRLIY